MNIAIDARCFTTDQPAFLHHFSKEVLLRLATLQPGNQFLFLVNEPYTGDTLLPANITIINVSPAPKNLISYQWWQRVKLPLILKKYKAALFIGTYGEGALHAKTPQIAIVHNLATRINATNSKSGLSFSIKANGNNDKKELEIVAVSNSLRADISRKYNIANEKISVLYPSVNWQGVELSWQEREAVKDEFAQGCEYFIFTANEQTAAAFINVLKAFSIFKKWQRSNMKLVVAEPEILPASTMAKMDTYRHRSDVIFLKDLPAGKFAMLTLAAYALIDLTAYEGFCYPIISSMNNGVPAIVNPTNAVKEVAEGSVLYASPGNVQDLAEQMKLIFKNEALRSQLIATGREKATSYSWDNTAEILLSILRKHSF